jgi:hypothetical protein
MINTLQNFTNTIRMEGNQMIRDLYREEDDKEGSQITVEN